jgi:hypothetical protein
VRTLFTGKREGERERGREIQREREREREIQREREREREIKRERDIYIYKERYIKREI